MGLIGAMRSAERERGGPLYPLYSIEHGTCLGVRSALYSPP